MVGLHAELPQEQYSAVWDLHQQTEPPLYCCYHILQELQLHESEMSITQIILLITDIKFLNPPASTSKPIHSHATGHDNHKCTYTQKRRLLEVVLLLSVSHNVIQSFLKDQIAWLSVSMLEL
jgi:hypothetical protein